MKTTRQIFAYYKKNKNDVTLLGFDRQASVMTLPEAIDGLPLTALGCNLFATGEELPLAEEETVAELVFVPLDEGESIPPCTDGEAVTQLSLPDTIEKIGAHAFLGCHGLKFLRLPERLEELPHHGLAGCTALEHISLPPTLYVIGAYAFYDCRCLGEIVLPETVAVIEQYAFYNCRSLVKINIPKASTRLGTGLFLNCDSLYDISFGRCRHVSDLIAVLNHELLLTIHFEQGTAKLLIPDFQYEYVEDTPARQFHQVNYGTGHLFRQCIGNSDIDFRRYDELFYLTKREDAAVLVLVLVVSRLSYPYRLQENRRETYLSYIREHLLWAAGYYMDRKEDEVLRHMADWGILDSHNLPDLIALAQNKKRTAFLSFLLNYQHKYFGSQPKKTFDL